MSMIDWVTIVGTITGVIRSCIKRSPCTKNGKQEERLCGGSPGNLGGRGEDEVHRREAVAGKLASAALMKRRVAREIGDHQDVHVAAVMRCALGPRTEKHDALRRESVDQTLDSPLNERRQIWLRFSLRHSSPTAARRRSGSYSATES